MRNLFVYLANVLIRIIDGYPNDDIDRPLPWAYQTQGLQAIA
jgi:hypothetical protein